MMCALQYPDMTDGINEYYEASLATNPAPGRNQYFWSSFIRLTDTHDDSVWMLTSNKYVQ